MSARTIESIRANNPAPAHVPQELRVDLFWAMGSTPNDLVDPYEPFRWLSGDDVPRILYNAPNPDVGGRAGHGSWVVTHYDDIERVYTDHDSFSNKGTAEFQALIGETFRSIPIAIDPPEHGKYRKFLMPWFAPSQLNKMDAAIRGLVREMMDEFVAKGEVDMAWDFARVYPVRIFMALMGFPPAMFEQFLAWEWDILHTGGEARLASLRRVLDFLRGFVAEKETQPDDALTSYIVHGQIEGRDLTDEEKIGMVWFLWLGGLDTVAATISQMFRRMVLQPEIQAQIRSNPDIIHTAVEEFLRTQPILGSMRRVRQDMVWHGIELKAGDQIQTLNCSGNFDPAQFSDPLTFDALRKPNRHMISRPVSTCASAHHSPGARSASCSRNGSAASRSSASRKAATRPCFRASSRSAICPSSGIRPRPPTDARKGNDMNDMQQQFEQHDFFRSNQFVDDPFAYFDFLRGRGPVTREPHQDIVMVTGYEEALAVYNDPENYSSCMSTSGPMGGNPIPLEGREDDDISELIEQYRDQTVLSDQLPTMDPPVHAESQRGR